LYEKTENSFMNECNNLIKHQKAILLEQSSAEYGADNEKRSKKDGIGKDGCYAVPSHSRSWDKKKRGAPCEAYCSKIFKAGMTWLECESMVKRIGCDKEKNETF
jgi:uncharacterized membrane protein